MKRALFLVALSSCLLGTACKKAEKSTPETQAATPAPAAAAPAPMPGHGGAPQGTSGMAGSGTVSETMNAGGYTYVKLDGSQGQVWAAAPETSVKVGDAVSFVGGMPMAGFRSNTLDRTFDMVYFVPGLTINGADPAAAKAAAAQSPGTASANAADADPAAKIGPMAKAKGGQTVAEVFAKRDALSGKEVLIRGQVVKYNAGIMGRNWVHLQDGSGAAGTSDLTVTTSSSAEVGATVLVKGTLALNKDFGAGYAYEVIVEDATVTRE